MLNKHLSVIRTIQVSAILAVETVCNSAMAIVFANEIITYFTFSIEIYDYI